jgi:hypothetical protein
LSTRPSSPVVGASLVPYHPALTRGTPMADVRHPGLRPPTSTQRRRLIFVVLIVGLVTAVGAIVLTGRSDPATTGAPSASTSTTTLAVTTTIGEREEVVARLRAILRVRDRAYRERDVGLLREVYTTDCPCLRGDGRAIEQLTKEKPGCWTRRRAFEQVRDGSNIQLLPYSLVSRTTQFG